jgi:hypothetical protein
VFDNLGVELRLGEGPPKLVHTGPVGGLEGPATAIVFVVSLLSCGSPKAKRLSREGGEDDVWKLEDIGEVGSNWWTRFRHVNIWRLSRLCCKRVRAVDAMVQACRPP